ncbi:Tenascin-R,Ficolin-3,Fibrinogen C domain-containing protein 1,Ficolin-2,Fibroleukin,Fibrinogen-like protein 1,Tenascin,Ficolin-1 [Mytilus edulis]|uniref:Tenascin-R,Ficolin-3,Fibrinogen C domain-containing protein 1,Ficolin-2,Fibroleukin,Fibrinogen-like protein 1,Tenascin,Ficolin-1 n=1 Tax=Mytilus edulis TaxID=6550 RepID=A0A8S3R511_MYTED|nr:Tenascin-R,Ficolin-3,Fibrinogen C domain-containing protein 1,Ficolin-2,Fibroleukin,Fibrinogen-like protein 1,Tenascin,Ficolin-1 [Mytilus edulis]
MAIYKTREKLKAESHINIPVLGSQLQNLYTTSSAVEKRKYKGVFQRRETGEEDFNREWIDYENGFGSLRKEFWLGNSKLYIITDQGRYELMVMIEDFKNNTAFARYKSFKIGDVFSNYKLSIEGYSGTAGNSLRRNNNRPFTTKDRHNTKFTDNKCEIYEEGPWWLHAMCFGANLNGKYLKEKSVYYGGIYWYDWQKSYKVTLQRQR